MSTHRRPFASSFRTLAMLALGWLTAIAASAQTVPQLIPATSVTVNGASSITLAFGAPVTYLATVTPPAGSSGPTPTGTAYFLDGAAIIGSAALQADGTASFTPAAGSLPAIATHAITAQYGGDSVYDGSTGTANLKVTKADTRTTVAAIPLSVYGQPVTLTATVAPTSPGSLNTPTGAVTFKLSGPTTLTTSPVALDAAGTATYTTATLVPGTYTLSASYTGDVADGASSSATGTPSLTVNQAPTQTALASSTGTSDFGAPVTFTATVSAAAGSGSKIIPAAGAVTFSAVDSGGAPIALTGNLVTVKSAGVATFKTAALPPGTGNIVTATYGGSTGFLGSAGTSIQTVAATGLSLASSANGSPITFGTAVTFTATVTPGNAAGAVSFTATGAKGAITLGSANLSGGIAILRNTTLPVDTYTVTAIYAVGGATAQPLGLVVDPGVTTTRFTSSANPSPFGSGNVMLNATVSGPNGTPTGSVTFTENGATLGTGSLVAGVTQLAFGATKPTAGVHAIRADYTPDGNPNVGPSFATFNQTISGDPTQTTVQAAPSLFYGQPFTHTATVTDTLNPGMIPTGGTVTFQDTSTTPAITLASRMPLVGGVATFSANAMTLGVGYHNITAVYNGDATPAGWARSTSAPVAQAVTQDGASVALALTSGTNPATFGGSLTFTATVTPVHPPVPGATPVPTPSGPVHIQDKSTGTTLYSGLLTSAGKVTFTTNGLGITVPNVGNPLSPHDLVAVYDGDTNFTGGTSTPDLLQDILQPQSTVTILTANPNPAVIGSPVTLTATVATKNGLPPTGTVTITDGSTTLGSANLIIGTDSSSYSLPVSTLAAGSHALKATYAPAVGSTFLTSSGTLTLMSLQNTVASLASSVSPSSGLNQPVTFTFTPSPAGATGNVTFVDTGTAPPTTLGVAGLNAGKAALTLATLSMGIHPITASYEGSATFSGASASLSHTVNADATAVAVTASKNPSVMGQSVTYTATVTSTTPGGGTPGGVVQFYLDTTADGSPIAFGSPITMVNGKAAITPSPVLGVGPHTISASYGDNLDVNFAASSSANFSQTVNQGNSNTSLGHSTASTLLDQNVTFTATVKAASPAVGTPTGPVHFSVFTTSTPPTVVLETDVNLAGGTATWTTSGIPVGSYSVTAAYAGDGNFMTSVSAPVAQTVGQGAANLGLTLTTGTASAAYGVPLTYTAALAPPAGLTFQAPPQGTVIFTATGTDNPPNPTVTSAPMAVGSASWVNPSLLVGHHAISASYSGDTNFTAASSAKVTQTITSNLTIIQSLSSSASPSALGAPVSFTATVASSSTPSVPVNQGSVVFYDGTAVLGDAPISNGQATFTTNNLALSPTKVGHKITAKFLASNPYAASDLSAAISQVVNLPADTLTTLSLAPSGTTTYGAPVTWTATVAAKQAGASAPTAGSVLFMDGTDVIANVPLAAGTASASFVTSALELGSHTLSASFSGNPSFNDSFSAASTLAVNAGPSTLQLAYVMTPDSPSSQPLSVTVTATVKPVNPLPAQASGNVTLTVGASGTPLSAPLAAGIASFTLPAASVAFQTVTASYGGDSHLAAAPGASATVVPGTFLGNPNDPLLSNLTGQTATLLADGRVFLAGGVTSTGTPVASGEIHDPASATAPLPVTLASSRAGHTATLLANGKVLLAGGVDATGHPLNTAEIVDPAPPAHVLTVLHMASRRSGHSATLLRDGTVLLVGGVADEVTGASLDSAEILDPTGGLPPKPPSLSVARTGHTATLLADGTVLVAGGLGGSVALVAGLPDFVQPTAQSQGSAEIYDPVSRQFLASIPLNQGRFGAAAVAMPSSAHDLPATSVLLAGGSAVANGVTTPLAAVEAYLPATGQFTSLAPLDVARHRPLAALLPDGQVLVGGGAGLQGTAQATGQILVNGNFFQLKSPMSLARMGGTATLLRSGLVFIAGGAPSTQTELFDPQDAAGLQPAPAPDVSLAASLTSATLSFTPAPVPDLTGFTWMLGNGAIQSGLGSATLNYSGPTVVSAPIQVDALVTSSLGIPAQRSASVAAAIGTPPSTPVVTVSPGPTVTQGTSCTASVQAQAGVSYQWQVNGTVVGGNTTSYSFIANTLGTTTIKCTVTSNSSGLSAISAGYNLVVNAQTGTVTVTQFQAVPLGQGTYGFTYSYTSSFGPATHASVTYQGGTPASPLDLVKPSQTVTITGPTTFTLVVQAKTHFSAPFSILVNPADYDSGAGSLAASTGDFLLSDYTGQTATLLPGGSQLALLGGMDDSGSLHGFGEIHVLPQSGQPAQTLFLAMAKGRIGHTTTLLPNGTLLVTGGMDSTGAPTTSLEVLSPSNAAPSASEATVKLAASAPIYHGHGAPPPPPALQAARTNHTATLLWNGCVLLAGGTDASGTALNTAEVYNPATQATTLVPMTSARSGHTATLLANGSVLLAGGTDASGAPLKSLERYVPAFPATSIQEPDTFAASGVFIALGTSFLNTARTGAAAVLVPTNATLPLWNPTPRLLLIGGSADAGGSQPLASVECLDLGSLTNVPFPSLVTPRTRPTATLLFDGRILVAGGTDGQGNPLDANLSGELFDPVTHRFTTAAPLDYPRAGHTATLLPGNQVYLAGGIPPAGTPPTPVQPSGSTDPGLQVELFNPGDNPSFQLPPSPSPAMAVVDDGTVQQVLLTQPSPEPTVYWTLFDGSATGPLGRTSINVLPQYPAQPSLQVQDMIVSSFGIPVSGAATTLALVLPTGAVPPGLKMTDSNGQVQDPGTPYTPGATYYGQVNADFGVQPGFVFIWQLTGGALPAIGAGPTFEFTVDANATGPIQLTCTGNDPLGNSAIASFPMSLGSPYIQFASGPAVIAQGTPFTLGWTMPPLDPAASIGSIQLTTYNASGALVATRSLNASARFVVIPGGITGTTSYVLTALRPDGTTTVATSPRWTVHVNAGGPQMPAPQFQVSDADARPVAPDSTLPQAATFTATVVQPQANLTYIWQIPYNGSPASGSGTSFTFATGSDVNNPLQLTCFAYDTTTGQASQTVLSYSLVP